MKVVEVTKGKKSKTGLLAIGLLGLPLISSEHKLRPRERSYETVLVIDVLVLVMLLIQKETVFSKRHKDKRSNRSSSTI